MLKQRLDCTRFDRLLINYLNCVLSFQQEQDHNCSFIILGEDRSQRCGKEDTLRRRF